LLFKMGFAEKTEYRQQIKTLRLKYIFLTGKIIRKSTSVVMKRCLDLNLPKKIILDA
jgi:hypothetical protein